jgi:predicted AlkP superfamily pyrophosphatase or phosphodiesterase
MLILRRQLFAAATVFLLGPDVCGAGPPPVRLAVLIAIDQMRGDYLERWRNQFGDGGFRRFQEDGAWFRNCHYPYAFTVTGPGHASMVTGCSPDRHGIVMNDWFDRAAGESVYCVGSDRHQRVPLVQEAADKTKTGKKPGGASPELLLASTVGDVLKESSGGRARVVSLSLKDRSAILMGGRRPDACYWFETPTGTFVTSTYYRERVHSWVEAFNREAARDRWFGKDWTRLRADLDYVKYCGPDDVPGEGTGSGQGRTFPHAMTGGAGKSGKQYYEAVYNSPFGNELLLELTLRAIDAERLGGGQTPDLLCVSFSSTDAVGHCWGPDSQEVFDVMLRMDDVLRRLLDHLDDVVGKGRYVVVLTADHGVCPLPEVSRRRGLDAARISPSLISTKAEQFLMAKFGKEGEKGRWVQDSSEPWVYLNHEMISRHGLKPDEVELALAAWLVKEPGVQAAYSRSQLVEGSPAEDPIAATVRKSFHADRSGDVAVVTKPYYLMWYFLTGTNHGTPHDYDTHVPLLIYGSGVQAGVRKDAVTPQAAASILARSLGIKRPEHAEAPIPEGLFANP